MYTGHTDTVQLSTVHAASGNLTSGPLYSTGTPGGSGGARGVFFQSLKNSYGKLAVPAQRTALGLVLLRNSGMKLRSNETLR